MLIGSSLMVVTHLTSASLILSYNLEDEGADGLSVSQQVAGYFVLVSVCVFLCAAFISVG
jgi:hypothetical protein